MVSFKTLKNYDFNSITDYFNYIVESLVNGQRTQCKTLYNKLSKGQKLDFWVYINGAALDHETICDLQQLTPNH